MSTDSFGTRTNTSALEFQPVTELSYEQARDELKSIVDTLEQGQMPLENSLAYWERGEDLAGYCENYLAGAREKIENTIAQRNQDLNEAEVHTDTTE